MATAAPGAGMTTNKLVNEAESPAVSVNARRIAMLVFTAP